MNIQIVKIPLYNSKRISIIMVDGKPICACRGKQTTAKIITGLQGYPVELHDGRIMREINKKVLERND